MKIPQTPPEWSSAAIIRYPAEKIERILDVAQEGPAPDGKYRHWETLRHIKPPTGLTSEEWWFALKLARQPLLRRIPLLDHEGNPFLYGLPDPVLERLHRIDRNASGHIVFPETDAMSPETRDRYIVSSLIEEAITSSQLEGAATTRAVAKEMLRSGRRPRDLGERMIFNNYNAMHHLRSLTEAPLTHELVHEVHGIVTAGTLKPDQSILRQPGDGINVYGPTGVLLHHPPPPDELDERMDRMCKYANEAETGVFLHPVLKSIILHFWLAYDHPFSDGNGRTARALFYWSMLKEGFWLVEYLSISRVLKKGYARYARSFLYTETDDNDLTYFILSQLRVLEQAIKEVQVYLRRKSRELRETRRLLQSSPDLNHRQVALLGHALRHPQQSYTVESHRSSHGVAYDTGRKDLLDLCSRGLLEKRKRGKKYVFVAVPDLTDKLRG